MTAPASAQTSQTVPYEALVAAAGTYTASQVIAAYVAQAAALRRIVFGQLISTWPGAFTDDDVEDWFDVWLPFVDGANAAMADMTANYLDELERAVRGRPVAGDSSRPTGERGAGRVPRTPTRRRATTTPESARGGGRPPRARPGGTPSGTARMARPRLRRGQGSTTADLRGLPAREVYRRPVTTNFVRRARGASPGQAEQAALKRARDIAMTDLSRAATTTARDKLADNPRVVGYRRVLTGAESCGLCIVASTQRYHKSALMPIHPNCDCVVAPIYGDTDPGRYVNTMLLTGDENPDNQYGDDDLMDLGDLLDDAHNAVIAEFGEAFDDARQIDYRKLIMTIEHGEMGPLLRVSRQKFDKAQRDMGTLAALPGTYNQNRRRR